MHKSLVILGRQPKLGIAELECLYGPELLQPYGKQSCFIDVDACSVDFSRLGGSVRLAKVLLQLPSTDWKSIEKFLINSAPPFAARSEGKLVFGLSTYGIKVSPKQVSKTALLLKKAIKNSGKSVRMVPHSGLELNSAVVLHNKLNRNDNWELLVISDGKTAHLAQTFFIQNIDEYSARDQARPWRDAKVGMLPPKLAQIMINLASDRLKVDSDGICEPKQDNQNNDKVLLDPFCGTGVVLQEAALMGFSPYGSDIEQRMIDYSSKNYKWLQDNHGDKILNAQIEAGDATSHKWSPAPDLVACETFLGQPLSSLPPSDQLAKIMQQANEINHKFLQNISPQLKPKTKLCIGAPTWRGKHEFLHLSAIDHLTEMGYTRRKLKHVDDKDLIYHRENQVVGRELLVLEKR